MSGHASTSASASSSNGRSGQTQTAGRGRGSSSSSSSKGKGRAGSHAGRGRGVRRAADYTPTPEVIAPHSAISEAARLAVERAEEKAKAEAAVLVDGSDVDGELVANEEREVELCYICAEPVKYYVLGMCSHRTCHVCAIRLRALYKKKECTFCKLDLPTVIGTVDSDMHFQDYPPDAFPCSDARLGIAFETAEMMEDTMALLRFNCPQLDCDYLANGWLDLKKHARTEHDRVFCDLCTKHKKIFSHEHTLFTLLDLKQHIKSGDPVPVSTSDAGNTGFTGHPECEFCRITFYDSDQLFAHCRDRHEQCFICIRNGVGRYQYYVDYPHLETHFQSQHHLCLNPQCLEQRFIVFDTELDLQAHFIAEHGATVGKTSRRVETNFSYTSPPDPRAGGGVQMRPRQPVVHASRTTPVSNPIHVEHDPVPTASSSTANEVVGSRGRVVPGLQRGGFNTTLSDTSTPNKTEKKPARDVPTMEESITGIRQTDPMMAARHASLLSRVSQAVGGSDTKLAGYRSTVRSYRSSEMSALDAVKGIYALLDNQADLSARIVTSTADLLDSHDKRNELNNAWHAFQTDIMQNVDAFPSLVPTAPMTQGRSFGIPVSGSSTTIRSSSSNRSLLPRSAKQNNSALWARVEQAAANKNVGAVPGLTTRIAATKAKDKFPALPSSQHAVSSQQPRGATPWASSRQPVTSPGSTYFPVASASAASSLAPSRTQSPAFSKPVAKPPSTSEFPGLPTSSVLQARAAQKAAIFGRTNEASPLTTGGKSWSSISPSATEEVQDAFPGLSMSAPSTNGAHGSGNPSSSGTKKKKGKQVLLHYGL